MSKSDFIRTAAVSPALKVANTSYNTDRIIACAREAADNGAAVILFPELAIPSYTCGDLFFQQHLYEGNLKGLSRIIEASASLDAVIIAGFYLRITNRLFDCAAVIRRGKLLGVVPKMFSEKGTESSESRWFAPGVRIASEIRSVRLFGEDIPFGRLLFSDDDNGITFGVEIGGESSLPVSPGAQLCLGGAQIIFHPCASAETAGTSDARRDLALHSSKINTAGYVSASCGVWESTTDAVYGGHCMIAENGSLIAENKRFLRSTDILYGEIDIFSIQFERSRNPMPEEYAAAFAGRSGFSQVLLDPLPTVDRKKERLLRRYEKNPFLPSDPSAAEKYCEEIFSIQTAGLAKRLEHAHAKTAVLGISGGLDSTLALLVCAETFRILGRPAKDIIAVTMPGFGTTDHTYGNALSIMKLLGTDMREISIADAVTDHFKAIGHDISVRDVTYENAQARERTQILMDIANETGGMVVGTGDLSEAALGWCTYNGDHMAMYNVNSSVTKTLVKAVVTWIADHKTAGPREDAGFSSDNAALRRALHDIIDTPISPELLPPDSEGKIVQKTEERVGPYILHEFFLYHTLRCGAAPEKLLYLAEQTFEDEFDRPYIKKWLREFCRRFFQQQYKRNCAPDGPKTGPVSLSPRGGLSMPSDADVFSWLDEIDHME